MKIKKTILFSLILSAPIFTLANTPNLVQIYQQALAFDPTFKKANADWEAQKENLPIAMTGNGAAGSGLFPNIDLTAGLNKNYIQPQGVPYQNYNSTNYQITLTQPIFNLGTWESISEADYAVKAATAQYLAASQDLMNRVVTNYFAVLKSNAALQATLTEKKMVYSELKQAKAKNKVGLIALTDVYDAQAQYDQTLVTEIKNQNALRNSLENLSSITGGQYQHVDDLKKSIPLTTLKQKSVDQWVQTALSQNYLLKADLNSMLASKKGIDVAASAKAPTVNLVGTYGNFTTPIYNGTQIIGTTKQGNATVGLNLNFPIFRGGYDIANIKQKRYQYLSASDQVNITKNTVIKNTRQAFYSVDSGKSQILADLQAVKAARAQLKATQDSYSGGLRTMSDVLNAVSSLAKVHLTYKNDRYNYVESLVNFKAATGTLSPEDIGMINAWLA